MRILAAELEDGQNRYLIEDGSMIQLQIALSDEQ